MATNEEPEYSNEIRALYKHLTENGNETDIADITELDYDYYGAPMLEIGGSEYAVITNDDIENVFHQYAENLIDDCVISELPEKYRQYFNYEKFEQDMSFDGYGQMASYDGNDNEVIIDDTYYHILWMN